LQWLEKNPKQSEVFNVGQGKGNSVLEVINQFQIVNDIPVPYEISPRRDGDIAQIFADPIKAEKLLGWKTIRTTSEALRDAWKFHLLNNPS
jgi:UDP-glucose 4-epimerase